MPRGRLTPEQIARKLAALASPETKAKMRAAKLGRPQSPEVVARRAAAQRGKPLSEAHRRAISEAQKGKTLAPEHLAAVRAAHARPESRAMLSARMKGVPRTDEQKRKISETKRGRPQSAAHRDAISRGQVTAYEAGRRKYNAWEERAAAMLLPRGWVRFPRYGGHAFDFGSGDGLTVLEVNGCRYHDHRAIKPSCPTIPKVGSFAFDEAYRAIARASGLALIELWGCEEDDWPRLIGIPSTDA